MADDLAMEAYLSAGQPPICPRCGAWDGPPLPSCVGPEGHRAEICSRTFYADDVCEACDRDMTEPTPDEATPDAQTREPEMETM